jgi:dihydropteroate synthase
MSAREQTPSRDVLEQRLEEQRRALWRAAGVVKAVVRAIEAARSPIDGTVDGGDATDARLALELAYDAINEATGSLEADVLLAAEEPGEGAVQEGES